MDFSEYQSKAKTTAIYPSGYKVIYPAMGLAGEVGEVLNKVKKKIRDDAVLDKEAIAGEIGDCMWYIAALSSDLDLSMDKIASDNIAKLQSRKDRGVIKGSGDNR